jgi:hypothetical protein
VNFGGFGVRYLNMLVGGACAVLSSVVNTSAGNSCTKVPTPGLRVGTGSVGNKTGPLQRIPHRIPLPDPAGNATVGAKNPTETSNLASKK